MKKGWRYILFFLIAILTGIISASLFGVLHDQITYSISNEYYTKFKFQQFGLDYLVEIGEISQRAAVSIVGLGATWWVGLFIGAINGAISLVHSFWNNRYIFMLKSTLLILLATAILTIIGYFFGVFFLANSEPNWWFPENLVDKPTFVTVGSMHNASYAGGLIGLILAIYYHLKNR